MLKESAEMCSVEYSVMNWNDVNNGTLLITLKLGLTFITNVSQLFYYLAFSSEQVSLPKKLDSTAVHVHFS